jgi:hypothetical protein
MVVWVVAAGLFATARWGWWLGVPVVLAGYGGSCLWFPPYPVSVLLGEGQAPALRREGVQTVPVVSGVRHPPSGGSDGVGRHDRVSLAPACRTLKRAGRRRVAEARLANPTRPGRPIEPFGLTKSEAKTLVNGGAGVARRDRPAYPSRPGRPIEPFGYTQSEAKAQVSLRGGRPAALHREALGDAVRRFSNTGGRTTIRPSRESVPRWVQLRNSAERLADDDLDALLDALEVERRRRRRTSEPSPSPDP